MAKEDIIILFYILGEKTQYFTIKYNAHCHCLWNYFGSGDLLCIVYRTVVLFYWLLNVEPASDYRINLTLAIDVLFSCVLGLYLLTGV